jgi:outer membrane protein OmpA-like peptidoglycan-associated protein
MVANWTAMSALCKPLLLGGLLLGLGACTTALPPEKVEAMGPPLPFNEQLKEGYLQLAEVQRSETHPINWYHFRSKAREAMIGDVVWPDKVATREVPQAAQADAIELHERLLRALEGGARKSDPADAAAAQVNFDCWLVELEAFQKPARPSDCKDSSVAALAKAESSLIHTPYVVSFDKGSDKIDPDGMNVVTYALGAARIAQPREISVTGYAETAGNSKANQALAQRRAEAVAKALRAGKPTTDSEIRVASRAAAPGTSAARARRVEITFGS